VSVELDAIPPDLLRELVKSFIELHLPRRQFEILKAAEESERELLKCMVRKVSGGVRESSGGAA
jgi:hypothetical protein